MFKMRKSTVLRKILADFEFDDRNTSQGHVYHCISFPLHLTTVHKHVGSDQGGNLVPFFLWEDSVSVGTRIAGSLAPRLLYVV